MVYEPSAALVTIFAMYADWYVTHNTHSNIDVELLLWGIPAMEVSPKFGL